MSLQHQTKLILHILSFLSDNLKAAVAKLVFKAAYDEFSSYKTIHVRSSSSGLPTGCLLQFLEQHASDCDQQQQLMAAVAAQGSVSSLQFLRQHGCAWGPHVCATAAKAGQLAVLQWLRAQDPPCEWDTEVFSAALFAGHLHVLQWLAAEAAPSVGWDAWTCAWPAVNGHLDVLQWLKANNPPSFVWNSGVCSAAAAKGHLEVLQWLRAQEPPCEWDVESFVWQQHPIITCTSCSGCELKIHPVNGPTLAAMCVMQQLAVVTWVSCNGQ